MLRKSPNIEWFEDLRRTDVAQVGGKNASLGEMVHALGAKGVRIPPGFATTADAYWQYIDANDLREEIGALLAARSPHARGALPEPAQELRSRAQRLPPRGLHVPFEHADVAAPIAAREAVPLVVGNAHPAVCARFRIALVGTIPRRQVPAPSAVAPAHGNREGGPARLADELLSSAVPAITVHFTGAKRHPA